MRTFLDHLDAHRSGTFFVLLLAAFLQAYGDSSFQTAMYRSSGWSRAIAVLIGATSLAAYGLVVNAPRWDFGRLIGVYVVLFFLLAQVVARVRFGQTPTLPVLCGGALIVAGGILISIWST
jgi:small multidrug resistance family-3 protein